MPEPAAATVLLAVVENADDLQFDETDLIALYKRRLQCTHVYGNHVIYTISGIHCFLYQRWTGSVPATSLSRNVATISTPYRKCLLKPHSKPCRRYLQCLAVSPAGQPKNVHPLSSHGKIKNAATCPNIVHWQGYRRPFTDGTLYHLHPMSSSG